MYVWFRGLKIYTCTSGFVDLKLGEKNSNMGGLGNRKNKEFRLSFQKYEFFYFYGCAPKVFATKKKTRASQTGQFHKDTNFVRLGPACCSLSRSNRLGLPAVLQATVVKNREPEKNCVSRRRNTRFFRQPVLQCDLRPARFGSFRTSADAAFKNWRFA